jgi:hypothetical protein
MQAPSPTNWSERNSLAPMTVWSCAVVVALLIGFGAPTFAKADEIDDYISVHMRQLHIPGVSLAIVRDGRVT